MKKFLSIIILGLATFALLGCASGKLEIETSSTSSTEQSSSTASSSKTEASTTKSNVTYPASQSSQLADTTYLFNGVDIEVAKTIERYVVLTSTYDFETFTQEEADKRMAELKTLKVNGELAQDEQTLFTPLLEAIQSSSASAGSTKLVQLGIFKDTTAEPDPSGLYDSTYQVAVSLATEQDGEVVHETTMVAMVWTKDNLIQASYSLADLQEFVDAEELFNNLMTE